METTFDDEDDDDDDGDDDEDGDDDDDDDDGAPHKHKLVYQRHDDRRADLGGQPVVFCYSRNVDRYETCNPPYAEELELLGIVPAAISAGTNIRIKSGLRSGPVHPAQ